MISDYLKRAGRLVLDYDFEASETAVAWMELMCKMQDDASTPKRELEIE